MFTVIGLCFDHLQLFNVLIDIFFFPTRLLLFWVFLENGLHYLELVGWL